jgi:hypothetical protein
VSQAFVFEPEYVQICFVALHKFVVCVYFEAFGFFAVMAKYNPFAEKAGMRRIAEQQPTEGVLRISELLSDFGFDLQLLGSSRYVFSKVEELTPAQIGKLKELFIKNKHPRFKKEFAVSRHQPFGKTSDYVACLENADLAKMAKLIKLVGMLLQSKVYLFWNQP